MLVLSRKLGETVVIDGAIKVVVLRNQGNQVKLGFEAPKAIKVYRQEIFSKIQREGISSNTKSIGKE
ncbi:MAG: carbon storage regulator CsrA [Gammaproteobacteria bacterium]